jgi:hypothetical protein
MLWLNKHAPHRNNLSPYVDGRLTPAQTTALEAHLAVCEPCRHELEDLRATIAAVGDLPQLETPRSFAVTPQMLERRSAAARAPSTPPFAIGMRMASAAMAVVLAVVVIRRAARSNPPRNPGTQPSLRPGPTSKRAMKPVQTLPPQPESASKTMPVRPMAIPRRRLRRRRNFAAECPSLGDQTAAGGASSPTPAPGATAQPMPSSTTGSGTNSGGAGAAGGATGACDEKSIAAEQDSNSEAPPAPEPAADAIMQNEAPEVAASSVDNDDSVSTLRVIEIVLAGALMALLAAVAADLVLRRHSI